MLPFTTTEPNHDLQLVGVFETKINFYTMCDYYFNKINDQLDIDELLQIITTMINACLTIDHFSDDWKQALLVKPVFKQSGLDTAFNNLRSVIKYPVCVQTHGPYDEP